MFLCVLSQECENGRGHRSSQARHSTRGDRVPGRRLAPDQEPESPQYAHLGVQYYRPEFFHPRPVEHWLAPDQIAYDSLTNS